MFAKWVAMVSMLMDHCMVRPWWGLVGNLAMPIYTFRSGRGSSLPMLLAVALTSEIPFMLMTGGVGNVVWIFLGVRAIELSVNIIREGEGEADPSASPPLLGAHALIAGGGIGMLTLAVWGHPAWVVWIPCTITRRWEVWYGIHGMLGAVLGAEWWIHLAGYEIAKRGEVIKVPGPPATVWITWYPAHMLGIAAWRALT